LSDKIRLAELLGSLSFAGDLGRGQPMGHVLRTTKVAMALSERLGVPSAQLSDVYFTSLLVHAGCTAGAAEFAAPRGRQSICPILLRVNLVPACKRFFRPAMQV